MSCQACLLNALGIMSLSRNKRVQIVQWYFQFVSPTKVILIYIKLFKKNAPSKLAIYNFSKGVSRGN